MRRYIVVMAVMALLVGSLFRAAEQTGVALMRMFGTIGIFLFGVVGTLALTRWQSREGLKSTQTALKSLEPDWLITDWALHGGGKPDYVLVGPAGVVAVCLAEIPQSTWARFAVGKVAKARERALQAATWLQRRLGDSAGADLAVVPLLVLTRRRAEPGYTADGVCAVNPDALADHIRSLGESAFLDERTRLKLTRAVRSA